MSSDAPDFDAVRRWVASLPTAEECARREVEPYLRMSAAERLAIFDALQRDADLLLGDRPSVRDPAEAEDFARRWRDPSVGRPS